MKGGEAARLRGWKTTFLCLAACLLWRHALSAHRLDEYLQAARIGIEPTRVELEIDLTPGTSVADGVFAAIDADHDGRISTSETAHYARQVLADVGFEIDGQAQSLSIGRAEFPDLDAMRQGLGTIRLTAAADVRSSNGAHQIVFRNRHRPDISVYLANALAPRDASITIAAQRRDVLQRELRIDYRASSAGRPWRTGASAAIAALVTALIVVRIGKTRPGQHDTLHTS